MGPTLCDFGDIQHRIRWPWGRVGLRDRRARGPSHAQSDVHGATGPQSSGLPRETLPFRAGRDRGPREARCMPSQFRHRVLPLVAAFTRFAPCFAISPLGDGVRTRLSFRRSVPPQGGGRRVSRAVSKSGRGGHRLLLSLGCERAPPARKPEWFTAGEGVKRVPSSPARAVSNQLRTAYQHAAIDGQEHAKATAKITIAPTGRSRGTAGEIAPSTGKPQGCAGRALCRRHGW